MKTELLGRLANYLRLRLACPLPRMKGRKDNLSAGRDEIDIFQPVEGMFIEEWVVQVWKDADFG